ncbi:MAG: deoxyribose-phosphate aldolase [Acidobacteriales bacterium]|nr:deoxyribose-phosphate aldolase [Terriglobales bacterium]
MSTTVSPIATTKVNVSDWRAVARVIDHTLLKPEATAEQVTRLCQEAVRFGFATAFVHPCYVPLAASLVQGTKVKVGAPVGFPQGANLTETKRGEAQQLLRVGAHELDMVLNIGALKSRERKLVENDIRAVVEIAHEAGALAKVILETVLLTVDEKILACELSVAAGADFVKTSTGFAGGGATVDDIALMRGVVGQRAGVKASGGIRSAADLTAMLDAGANRIGTSAGVQIMQELGATPKSGIK